MQLIMLSNLMRLLIWFVAHSKQGQLASEAAKIWTLSALSSCNIHTYHLQASLTDLPRRQVRFSLPAWDSFKVCWAREAALTRKNWILELVSNCLPALCTSNDEGPVTLYLKLIGFKNADAIQLTSSMRMLPQRELLHTSLEKGKAGLTPCTPCHDR